MRRMAVADYATAMFVLKNIIIVTRYYYTEDVISIRFFDLYFTTKDGRYKDGT